jgi:hypothetical protein
LPRERRRNAGRKRPHAINSDLTKKAIEVVESMTKAKTIKVEAKLMIEKREIMLIDTTNMMEGQKACVEKHRAIIQQRDA